MKKINKMLYRQNRNINKEKIYKETKKRNSRDKKFNI